MGTSILAVQDGLGKVEAVQAILESNYAADEVSYWSEVQEVTESGDTDLIHFFEYPTDYAIGDAITKAIMGDAFVTPVRGKAGKLCKNEV